MRRYRPSTRSTRFEYIYPLLRALKALFGALVGTFVLPPTPAARCSSHAMRALARISGLEPARSAGRLDLRTLTDKNTATRFLNLPPEMRKPQPVVRPIEAHFPGDNHDASPSWKRPAGRWLTPWGQF